MTAFADMLFQALADHGATPALEAPGGMVVTHAELRARAEARAAELSREGAGGFRPLAVLVDNRPADLVELLAAYRCGAVVAPVHRATPPARLDAVRQRLNDAPAANGAVLDGAGTIVFTSGSTGTPKAVVLSAERQARKLAMIRRETGWEDGGRTLLALQLTFSFGQWVTWLTLLTGGCLIFPERLSAPAVATCLHQGAVDRLPAVPTLLRGLLAETGPIPRNPAALTVMAGGEALSAGLGGKIAAAWPGVRIGDIYGSTETGTCDFFVDPEDYGDAAGSLGRPGADIETTVAVDGELRVRSPYAMRGYLDEPALTAAAVDDDGYFRTGDLVTARADGRLALIGRSKELINRGGFKVAPLEVEAVLAAHADVAGALVTGVSDPRTGEAVAAVITAAPGRTPDPAAVLDWAGARLERFKLPSRIQVVDALPTGGTGKADRSAVASLFRDD